VSEIKLELWYGDFCKPSKEFLPLLEKVAEEYSIPLEKFNVEIVPQEAKDIDIRATPTLIIKKDGWEVSRKVGQLEENVLLDFIGKELIP